MISDLDNLTVASPARSGLQLPPEARRHDIDPTPGHERGLSATSDRFVEGLDRARRRLHRAHLRVAAGEEFERALVVCGFAAGAASLTIILARASGAPAALAIGAGGIGVVAIAATAAARIVPALLARPALDDVAERLDLSTPDGHNRIATALDLAGRGAAASAFDRAAIAEGLRHLERHAMTPPVLPRRPIRARRDALLIAGAIAMLVAACTVPVGRIVGANGVATVDSSTLIASRAGVAIPRLSPEPQRPPKPPAARAATGATSHGGDAAARPAHAADPAGAAAAGDAGVAHVATGVAGQNQLDRDAKSEPGTDASPAAGKPSTARPAEAQPARGDSPARADDSAGGAGAPQGTKDGATQKKPKSKPSLSGEDKTEGSPGGSAAGQSGPPPPDASEPGDGGVSNGAGDDRDLPPGGSGTSLTASDSAKPGLGRSTGPGAPKKARGVAPLLLGTRQPDLFQARPLSGPDERTRLEVPPQRDPGTPAMPADTSARAGDERPQDVYRVPPELHGVVDRYFQAFHEDALVPQDAGR